jgi:hypothetical protein
MKLDFSQIYGEPDKEIKPYRLICTEPTTYPEKSLISFEVVETIGDIIAQRNSDVCLVFPERSIPILKCWTENQGVFDREPMVLTGVPGTTEEPDFERYSYNLEKIAYHSVVADLAEEVRRAQSMTEDERNNSIYAKEQAAITRKSGEVKVFTAFTAPNMDQMETGEERVPD